MAFTWALNKVVGLVVLRECSTVSSLKGLPWTPWVDSPRHLGTVQTWAPTSVFTKGTVLSECTKVYWREQEPSFHLSPYVTEDKLGLTVILLLPGSRVVFSMPSIFKRKMISRNWIKMGKLSCSDLSVRGQSSAPVLHLPSPSITFTAPACPPSPLSIKYTVNTRSLSDALSSCNSPFTSCFHISICASLHHSCLKLRMCNVQKRSNPNHFPLRWS